MTVVVPRRLLEELERRGFDAESFIVDLLAKSLSLDLRVAVESHLEFASRYLEGGWGLADKDPIQASERLYKAAEALISRSTVEARLRCGELHA